MTGIFGILFVSVVSVLRTNVNIKKIWQKNDGIIMKIIQYVKRL